MSESIPSEPSSGLALYAGVGPELIRYRLDVSRAELTACEAVRLPANVQYAVADPSGRTLYVASSDRDKATAPQGSTHHVTAFRIAPGSGVLSALGAPCILPERPIHLTIDPAGEHILIACSKPARLRIFRINQDATIGAEVLQDVLIEVGIYPHQIRVTADGAVAILVSRGNSAKAEKPEEPGALKIFSYHSGQLTGEKTIAPNGGYGFGPRHLDFHPDKPWIYVAQERQNKLAVFARAGSAVEVQPIFVKDVLADPSNPRRRQLAGTVHVHPSGRFVYVVNRADATDEVAGRKVFAGGENNLAVYAIDQETGEPALIQHADTNGIHCRTFHIDPSGRILVAAHIKPLDIRQGSGVQTIPARLCVFRIAENGRLTFVRAYDVDVGNAYMFWMGMVKI